jgi:hypothetical protein
MMKFMRDSRFRAALCALLLCLPAAAVQPQAALGAADMDRLLDTEAVDFASASLWVQSAAGLAPGGPEGAFALAGQNGLLPAGAEAGDPVRLDEFAFMLARALEYKGGIMYTLFPGPRYAYRELVYRRVLEGRTDPAQAVSGERLLYFLGRAFENRGPR